MLVTTATSAYIFKKEWDCFKTARMALLDGECEELIAYYNGQPVSEKFVSKTRDLIVKPNTPHPLAFKALGAILIKCTDKAIEGVDLGTLLRHFDYVSDLYELDPNIKEIQLPFSAYEVSIAIFGAGIDIAFPKDIEQNILFISSIRNCFDCVEYLRPKNSSYYLRYIWDLERDLSLKLESGRVISKEDVLKFMRFIGSSLPMDVRMYRGGMSGVVMDYDLYPIVEIAQSTHQTLLLRLLVSNMPSALLYCACFDEDPDFSLRTILLERDFENEKLCFPVPHWETCAQGNSVGFLGSDCLASLKELDRHRVLASLGFRDAVLGNVGVKPVKPYHRDLPTNRHAVASILYTESPAWMTPDMRTYFEKFLKQG